MWLPTYYLTTDNFGGILKAFAEVFPHVAVWYEPSTLNAFTIVTGKMDSPVWDPEKLRRAFALLEVEQDLASLEIFGPADLMPLLLATEKELAPWLEAIPVHTDDRPRVEYESGRLLDRNQTWLDNFTILLQLRPATPPAAYLELLPPADKEQATALYRERTEVLEYHRRLLAERLDALSRRDLF